MRSIRVLMLNSKLSNCPRFGQHDSFVVVYCVFDTSTDKAHHGHPFVNPPLTRFVLGAIVLHLASPMIPTDDSFLPVLLPSPPYLCVLVCSRS